MVSKVCYTYHSLTSSGTMSFSLFKVNKKLKSFTKFRKSPRRKDSKLGESILLEFCEYTNLHGFNSLLNEIQLIKLQPRSASRVGLIIWLVTIFCGIFFTVYLFMLVYAKYKIQPTIMTIETNYLQTWKVDFPGVTICNVNAIYKPNTLKLTKEL